MANCTIKEGNTYDLFCDNTELVFEHGQLVCGPRFTPNVSVIKILSEAGQYTSFVLDHEGETVGYCTFITYQESTLAWRKTAECLAVYTKPEFRGRPAIQLIKHAIDTLKSRGVQAIKTSVPAGEDKQARVYQKLGFKELETAYVMEL